MAVRKIHGSWWVDFRFNHKRHRKRSPDNSKAGAKAYEALLRQKLARGEPINEQKSRETTFVQFVQEWFKTYVEANNKPSERSAKESILRNHLIPAFGTFKLAEIRAADIERYKAAKLIKGVHPKTLNNHLAVLRKCLRSAAEWEHITGVPIIKPVRVPPLSIDFLSDEEYDALLVDKSTDPLTYRMILTALNTGMRIGELLGLEWQAIDFQENRITVRRSIVRGVVGSPKSNRIRHIPMTKDLKEELWQHRKPSGLVFPSGKEDRPLVGGTVARYLNQACDRADVRQIGWHLLRHTFASRLVSRGVAIRSVQELLGHSTVTMTERYAHLAPSVLSDAIRVLENRPNEKVWATGGQQVFSSTFSDLFPQRVGPNEMSLKQTKTPLLGSDVYKI